MCLPPLEESAKLILTGEVESLEETFELQVRQWFCGRLSALYPRDVGLCTTELCGKILLELAQPVTLN